MMFTNNEHDQVPIGVVHSMKQRLLEKLNQHQTITIQPNLIKQLSHSQDNLLSNTSISQLNSKENLIIIDRTQIYEHKQTTQRHSYSETIIDEIPKPGTVSTVKNMFEQQIRLSRTERTNHKRSIRNNRHSTRARSVSPNDMALRQRRIATVPTTTSVPDVIISHRPMKQDPILSDNENDEQLSLNFKSRLALFNRIDTNEQLKTMTFTGEMKFTEQELINIDDIPDVIGTNIKLIKSSIFSGIKKQTHVQFIDDVRTYEYPSFDLLMSEYSSNSDSESDNHMNEYDDNNTDDEFEQIYAEYSSSVQSKGSLQTFRPTYLDRYELGSQQTSDRSKNMSNIDTTNPIEWTADLLF